MSKWKVGMVIVCSGIALCGCANRAPLTSRSLEIYALSTEQVTNLQFFVSRDITLQRHSRVVRNDVEDAKLHNKSNELFSDRLWIEKGKPGIAMSQAGDILKVSFELDGTGTLDFKLEEKDGFKAYRLFLDESKGQPIVWYRGDCYDLINGKDACLLYDRRLKDQISYEVNRPCGRRFANY